MGMCRPKRPCNRSKPNPCVLATAARAGPQVGSWLSAVAARRGSVSRVAESSRGRRWKTAALTARRPYRTHSIHQPQPRTAMPAGREVVVRQRPAPDTSRKSRKQFPRRRAVATRGRGVRRFRRRAGRASVRVSGSPSTACERHSAPQTGSRHAHLVMSSSPVAARRRRRVGVPAGRCARDRCLGEIVVSSGAAISPAHRTPRSDLSSSRPRFPGCPAVPCARVTSAVERSPVERLATNRCAVRSAVDVPRRASSADVQSPHAPGTGACVLPVRTSSVRAVGRWDGWASCAASHRHPFSRLRSGP